MIARHGRSHSIRAGGLFAVLLAFAFTFAAVESRAQSGQTTVIDSLSPVFRSDSAQSQAIRSVEAGTTAEDSLQQTARRDSLDLKLKRRGPYIGLTVGVAFGEHSERNRFSAHMNVRANENGQDILQPQDPVHVIFPGGLVAGYPVLPHFDVQLRSEHFHYTVTGLAQKDAEPATEYTYTNQAHLLGAGLRWLVPVSLLTVTGQPGLYLSYTHFWDLGQSGIRSPDGSLVARSEATGAGYEIQAGFQQDYDARWALIGGLGFSRLAFRSRGNWSYVALTSPPETAEWTITSMRFVLQGLYHFGR